MSQQGDKHGHEDDWWGELYDPRRADAGPAAATDSVDDRFDSAARTLGCRPGGGAGQRPTAGAPWGPREEPGGAAPGPDAAEGGGPQGWRSPGGDEGPGAAPPSPPRTATPSPARTATPPPARPNPASPARPNPASPARAEPPSSARTAPAAAPGSGASAATAPIPSPVRPSAPDPAPAGTPPADPARPWRAAVAGFVGSGPPTYEAEPTTLPVADPEELGELVPDTVLDGARYGTFTLRAVSLRGDSARYRGEPRRDALLTARFGTGDGALVLVVVAGGVRASPRAHQAAREVCEWIGGAVGRSRVRLTEDLHTADRGALKSGLHRLTSRGYGRLRARAIALGLDAAEYTASVRCLLLPAHPACRTRVFFGVGGGGLFRLREGGWQDLEPAPGEGDTVGGPVLGHGDGRPPASAPPEGDGDGPAGPAPDPAPTGDTPPDAPAGGPFLFRASVARPGDTLLLCGEGLADPLRGEAALADHLAERWAGAEPPGLAAYLADAQTRVKGYADDRTAVAVWEA
ncbi:protein phosphatase 2C domain-containing protein [Streptomyces sp. NA02950]|uniref:protein phosphatase 2C domain-containing protein n=1 Tax=Streptomyces sp. NA02950 TaxID=2742137 RepID=UPI0015908481|nr:protein phosphatase 2C domain-containing protein [Streptomyces sp. NA02950]QKV91985.1 protein phosphatase 2C domain-containing protein [Streptomyces sp. NA02950]